MWGFSRFYEGHFFLSNDQSFAALNPSITLIVYEDLYKSTINKNMINWVFLTTVETFIIIIPIH